MSTVERSVEPESDRARGGPTTAARAATSRCPAVLVRAVVLGAALVAGSLASAQGAAGTVATGLNAPQGLLIGPDGTIYVADSGTGGAEILHANAVGAGGSSEAPTGVTARVLAIAADGGERVLAQVRSIRTPNHTDGAADLALLGGELYAAVSAWPIPGAERPSMAGTIVRVSNGKATVVADTFAFEAAHNPDGLAIDSHPYRVATGPDGKLWVTDAAANDLLRVDPATGQVSLVTAFARLSVPAGTTSAGPSEMEAVPTGLVVRPDGSSLVAFLTGYPFPSGASKIVEVAADGSVSDFAAGLTMTTDLERGPDGGLYAVEFAVFGPNGPEPDTGELVLVTKQGPKVVLDHLPFPTAVAFTPTGDALLALDGIGEPGSGRVSKYPGVAVP